MCIAKALAAAATPSAIGLKSLLLSSALGVGSFYAGLAGWINFTKSTKSEPWGLGAGSSVVKIWGSRGTSLFFGSLSNLGMLDFWIFLVYLVRDDFC